MKQAMIAVEDRRYFEHRGVDMRAIGRALWADIRKQGVVQGGSTITQQFIKNSCSDNGRTIGRKVREATLAWGLEQRWSKKKILTAYLNTVYFGNGAYGVDQAARTYFGHRAKKMTLWEVALLAGIPADPSRYDPVANPAGREAAPPDRAPHHARARDDRRRAVPARRPRAAAEEDHAAGHPRARRLLRELRHPAARRPLQDPGRLRRRPRRPHDARPRAPEARPPRDRPLAQGRQRPGRRARRNRPEGRRRQGDDRRLELPGEPVQPRRSGRAPGRLVVQALRPGRRARAGDLPRDDVRLQADDDLPRRQVLAGLELRGRVPRLGEPEDGDDPLGQLGLRAAHGARRAEQRPPGGPAARDLEPPERLFLDRPRYRGGQSARDGARVLDVRQPWAPRRRLDLRQQAACDLVGAPGRREAPSQRSPSRSRCSTRRRPI